jgi:hypothetical protein
MTLFPKLSNFLFSPRQGGGLAGLVRASSRQRGAAGTENPSGHDLAWIAQNLMLFR